MHCYFRDVALVEAWCTAIFAMLLILFQNVALAKAWRTVIFSCPGLTTKWGDLQLLYRLAQRNNWEYPRWLEGDALLFLGVLV